MTWMIVRGCFLSRQCYPVGKNTRPPIFFIINRNEKEETLTRTQRGNARENRREERKEGENWIGSIQCSLFFHTSSVLYSFFFLRSTTNTFSFHSMFALFSYFHCLRVVLLLLEVSSRYMTKSFIHSLYVRLSLSHTLFLTSLPLSFKGFPIWN